MGLLKVKGVNVNDYIGELYTNKRTKQTVLGTKIKGFNSNIDSGIGYAATGWLHDVFQGKLKYNGNACSCAPQGTRPMNITSYIADGLGITLYIYNTNGNVYCGNSLNSGELILSSKEANKEAVINLALWGAGGKGGGGAYYFLAGNWGGVGGGGGAKAFYTIVLKNNTYCYVTLENDATKTGRLNCAKKAEYQAPNAILYASDGYMIANCGGGYSGVHSNTREWTDPLTASSVTVASPQTITRANVTFYLRKKTNGTAKQYNGLNGGTSYFYDELSPTFGNPENNQGALITVGNGGSGYNNTRAKNRGSGGGGSYSNGGKAGDNGSGSNGTKGVNGGGGGGSGSPSGGASGGDGGFPGLMIFY